MANIWIPDKRLILPELFEPGRKPVGQVKVDHEHVLGKGIVAYWLPINPSTGNELVNKRDWSVISGSTLPEYANIEGNIAADFYGGTATAEVEAEIPFSPGTGDYSLIVWIRHADSDTTESQYSYPIAFDAQCALGTRAFSQSDEWVIYDGSFRRSGEVLSYSTDYCLIATRRNGTLYLYRNGIQDASFSQTNNITANNIVFGNWRSQAFDYGDFRLYAAAVLNRGVTQVEALEYSRNWYQFLKPAADAPLQVYYEIAEAAVDYYPVPDKRLRMPELFEPGRKPVGPVRLKKSHPYYKNLLAYIPFNEHGGAPRDLVTGRFLDNAGGGSWTTTPHGIASDQNISAWTLSTGYSDDQLNELTVIALVYNPSDILSQTSYVYDARRSAAGGYFFIDSANFVKLNGSTWGTYADFFKKGLIGCAFSFGVDVRRVLITHYGESTEFAQDAEGAGERYFGSIVDVFQRYVDSGACHADGLVFFAFDRIFTLDEIRGFFRDPYQFLEPAADIPLQVYYEEVPAAGGIYLGANAINNLALGSNEADAVYLGNNLIWQK